MIVRTRFAPSPTGSLHVGGIRTALFSWLHAKHNAGEFILRIEDTDRERSTDEATKIILDGMSWLNLDYDKGPYFQSKRLERYKEIIQQLIESDNAYYCYCSKEKLDVMREEAMKEGKKPRYNGSCRDRSAPPPKDVDPVVRFKTPFDGSVVIDDLVQGKVVFQNIELDDLIIARTDGTPTYNLTVVVDDIDMEITDIVRGDDHLNNTPRQVNIFNALGVPQPNYAHIPMILGVDGKKLSKRDAASSILEYRDKGYLPEALLNYLVRLGWSKGDQEIFSIDEMISEFDLRSVNKSASSINPKKLLWLNQHYIKNSDNEKLIFMLNSFFDDMNISIDSGPDLSDLVSVQKDRIETVKDLAEQSTFFYEDFKKYDEKIAEKYLQPVLLKPFKVLYEEFDNNTSWDNENIKSILNKLAEEFDIKIGKLAQPLRVAITGKNVSPGIYDTVRLLGREKTLKRLNNAIKFIESLGVS
jgi:glutamyl-tRNA synthetase